MSKKDLIKKELEELVNEGQNICNDFIKENIENFKTRYQIWYTKALKAVELIAPDRLRELKNYYEADPQRKSFGYGYYVIQDYMIDVVPSSPRNFDNKHVTAINFMNQVTIVLSIQSRIDSLLANIETEIYSELQDNEVSTAKQLAKINLRSAGALLGVIIEGHLQKVATAHNVKISKKYPTISELNDLLKKEKVVNDLNWRKILCLADIRNLCSHKKGNEPTKEQIQELIQGTEWLVKNVF